MTVARLLDEMPAEEFDDWCRFYSMEPFGYDTEQLRAGIIAAEIHNSSGFAKRAARPRDFFPSLRRDDRPKDAAYWQEAQEACQAFVKRKCDGRK